MDSEQVRKAAEDIHEAARLSAEEIKAMARRLLELEEANRWIPVSERLPQEDGAYRTYDGEDEAIWGFYEGEWCSPLRIKVDSDCSVITHWRPLPAPPATDDRGMKPPQEVKP